MLNLRRRKVFARSNSGGIKHADTILAYLLSVLLLCRIAFSQYSSDQCSWKGSGLTHEGHTRDVEQVYLRCSQGSLDWLYPTGAVIVNLRPNTLSPAAARLSVCIKPSRDSHGANIYLDRAGKLRLLLREQDQAQGKVTCFSIQEGSLFIEAIPHRDISKRITSFQYELVTERTGAGAGALTGVEPQALSGKIQSYCCCFGH
ncbi:meteorin-like protein [Salvelinus sp. IW2-2015]|uniref:meteorin-like protein n=1 Tax=Salvelinus sp. IW2-2015 TaxID=2691554 RepID=UPI0038D37244